MATLFSDLSGSGKVTIPGGFFDGLVHVDVTSQGLAMGLDGIDPDRFLHLGWIACYEASPHSDLITPADYLSEWRWVSFLHQSILFIEESNSVLGFDGVYYRFQTGVVANLLVGG